MDLCGKTGLHANLSVYRAANLFFGVDSGPMHMAAAWVFPWSRSSVLLMNGSGGPGVTVIRLSPGGSRVIPANRINVLDNDCMKRISVEEALEAVEKKLSAIMPKIRYY